MILFGQGRRLTDLLGEVFIDALSKKRFILTGGSTP
jgi:hypothetical protein